MNSCQTDMYEPAACPLALTSITKILITDSKFHSPSGSFQLNNTQTALPKAAAWDSTTTHTVPKALQNVL